MLLWPPNIILSKNTQYDIFRYPLNIWEFLTKLLTSGNRVEFLAISTKLGQNKLTSAKNNILSMFYFLKSLKVKTQERNNRINITLTNLVCAKNAGHSIETSEAKT